MNIKQAIKRGMHIVKQVQYYGIDEGGVSYILAPDWAEYYKYEWRKKPKKKRRSKRSKGTDSTPKPEGDQL